MPAPAGLDPPVTLAKFLDIMSLRHSFRPRVALAFAGFIAGTLPASASPVTPHQRTLPAFIQSLDVMMAGLAPESARASAAIRRLYGEYLDLLTIHEYADLEGALGNGGLVPLPDDLAGFNLAPRLDGPHPIGEKDLDNQHSYVAARPATIGALIEIASQVKSGPVEVTSLVRHGHYQNALRTTNANATTSVPTHTLGLAFDIGLVNSPLSTAREIRDVLRRMQRAGDILFIAERRQLVFHVVPHPSRLGHFHDLYMKKVGLPPTGRFAEVVADGPAPPRRTRGVLTPSVTAEVVAVLPAVETLVPADAPEATGAPAPAESGGRMSATPAGTLASATLTAAWTRGLPARLSLLLVALLVVAWRIAARPQVRPSLFEYGG
jgi:hypothetical protein